MSPQSPHEEGVPTVITSPISGTEIPAEEKWKNKVFLREYQRQRRYNLGQIKTRPRIAEDGVTLYRDKYPHLVKQSYYTKKPRAYCDVCNKDMAQGYLERHLESRAHRHQVLLQQPSPTPSQP